jgi:hypothetical protein
LIVQGNATATANNIAASETLFRAGIAAQLISQILFMWVALALYDLLKEVNQRRGALMLTLIVVSIPIALLNELNAIAALILVRGADFLSIFEKTQRDALAMLFLNLRPADGELLFLCGHQFYVLAPAAVRKNRQPMDDAAPVWRTVVHVLASDQGRKPKAISGSGLLFGVWLGALTRGVDKSGVPPQLYPVARRPASRRPTWAFSFPAPFGLGCHSERRCLSRRICVTNSHPYNSSYKRGRTPGFASMVLPL